jgi:hypothetical protein
MMDAIQAVLSGEQRWALLAADCRDVLPAMPRRVPRLHVITDPPFLPHVHATQRRIVAASGSVADGALDFGSITPELRRFVARQFARVATRWIIIKSDEDGRPLWRDDLEGGGARNIRAGTWWKAGAQPNLSGRCPAVDREALQISIPRGLPMGWNGGGKHGSWGPYASVTLPPFPTWRHVIAQAKGANKDRWHTTQTPVELWLDLVEDFTNPDDIVLDAFAGSGSLGIACLRLGRRYIGMELNSEWAERARAWLQAEEKHSTLRATESGQRSLFG